ncbi:MAG TPA: HD-GYP domain-containing protein [Gaiellaceae bacterium]|nr:HD-GYP domain-containing protein [Gaiellaceae bacterium]
MDANRVNALITLVASVASAVFVILGDGAWRAASGEPEQLVVFCGLAVALQLAAVEIYGRGALSFSGMGILATGFALGPGSGMVAAMLVAIVNLFVLRGRLDRAAFNAANLSLSAAAATGLFHVLGTSEWTTAARLLPATGAGIVFMVVNIGLLSFAMSLAEGLSMQSIWRERFRWFTPYYLISGPLALATTVAFEEAGLIGMLAFGLPPAIMMFSIRQYIARTRDSVEEVRRANEELRLANTDLQVLFQFAGGLGARSHDRSALVEHAERQLLRLTGTLVHVSGPEQAGLPLVSGGNRVGTLVVDEQSLVDRERWERLREAILPQLATALESAELIDEVRKQHLATIAALCRSIEAKDGSTGEHTERVAELAVELARRLGYAGAELDAIEIGALLHDIGKIGVPEAILHKPGPLTEEEWKVMKRHPLVSEHILAGIGLSPVVLQIARSSHERFDGEGYPDGIAGEDIPLPARIVLVADAFDAITSDRPYRRGRSVVDALGELHSNSGKQFCPRVVAALEQISVERPHLLGAGRLRAVERVA